jgi:DMSO/TMAO reductase YedYZ molybdopterin-dependent catalytic subunit
MDRVTEDRLPPAQYVARGWPVMHYGPVPRLRPEIWDFRVSGATKSGQERSFDLEQWQALPHSDVTGDFHCVTKFSMLDNVWRGVTGKVLVDLVPPHEDATHVMVWAEFGYSANVRLDDFIRSVLATERNGQELSPEHGWPLRFVAPHLYAWKSAKWVRGVEYLTADRRGFWEERGYHNVADPWREQRYSYQEQPGEGPAQRRS